MTTHTQQNEKTASTEDMPTLIITVDGGLVSNVKFPHELEGRLTVRVEDEDIEGVDEDRLTRDPDGRKYHLTVWP